MESKLCPPKLTRAQIRKQADDFLATYNPTKIVPTPIEEIVELQLKLNMTAIKGLKEKFDVDGFINSKCDEITIDDGVFLKFKNRSRYTMAHEIGHMILHKSIYCQSSFASIDEYVKFIDGIPETDNGWLQWQANTFAAFVLMPTDILRAEVNKIITSAGLSLPIKPEMIETSLFENLPAMFGVSPVALLTRMVGEGMITPPEKPY